MSTIDTLEAGRELDALVAEKVMGFKWHCFRDDGPKEWGGDREIRMLRLKLNVEVWTAAGWRPIDPSQASANVETLDLHSVPEYSTDIAAAFEMEAEIERQGLAREYIRALSVIAGIANYANMHQRYWLLTHATACQRCAAALQAIEDPAAERRMQYRESPAPPYVQAEIDRGLKLGKKAAEISERKKGDG